MNIRKYFHLFFLFTFTIVSSIFVYLKNWTNIEITSPFWKFLICSCKYDFHKISYSIVFLLSRGKNISCLIGLFKVACPILCRSNLCLKLPLFYANNYLHIIVHIYCLFDPLKAVLQVKCPILQVPHWTNCIGPLLQEYCYNQ